MAFRFSLETVLRLRRSLEDSERLRLETLLAQRAQIEREIGDTLESYAALNAKLKQTMEHDRLPGAELQFAIQRLRGCELQVARLHAAIATLAQTIARQQALLLRRRRDRKVLEHVRERQFKQYEAEAQHRGQAEVEELFLLRRASSNQQLATSN